MAVDRGKRIPRHDGEGLDFNRRSEGDGDRNLFAIKINGLQGCFVIFHDA